MEHTLPQEQMGATTAYLIEELKKRGIPFKRFKQSSLITLGYGSKQRLIRTAVADTTSGLGIEMAGDKDETKQILAYHHIPTPEGYTVYDEDELKEAFQKMKLPVVIKPLDGNHGRGVTTHIDSFEKALFGFRLAKEISGTVIIEEFIEGDDHRFLVIDYKLVAVSKRTPAMIVGNGLSSIRELIEQENTHPDRGYGPQHVLAPIEIDETTLKILEEKNLTVDSILPKGESLYVKDTANISAGGTSTDLTDEVHPENIFLAERVARIFNLNICGIDVMSTNVAIPLSKNNGGIIEVNAGPGLRMHSNPTYGKPRNVAGAIMDMLFPDGDYRIPVIAIVANDEFMADFIPIIVKQTALRIGYNMGNQLYVNDHKIKEDTSSDYTEWLFEPTIDFAVINLKNASPEKDHFELAYCDMVIIAPEIENVKQYLESLSSIMANPGYFIIPATHATANIKGKDAYHTIVQYGNQYNEALNEHFARKNMGIVIEQDHPILKDVATGREIHLGAYHDLPNILGQAALTLLALKAL